MFIMVTTGEQSQTLSREISELPPKKKREEEKLQKLEDGMMNIESLSFQSVFMCVSVSVILFIPLTKLTQCQAPTTCVDQW